MIASSIMNQVFRIEGILQEMKDLATGTTPDDASITDSMPDQDFENLLAQHDFLDDDVSIPSFIISEGPSHDTIEQYHLYTISEGFSGEESEGNSDDGYEGSSYDTTDAASQNDRSENIERNSFLGSASTCTQSRWKSEADTDCEQSWESSTYLETSSRSRKVSADSAEGSVDSSDSGDSITRTRTRSHSETEYSLYTENESKSNTKRTSQSMTESYDSSLEFKERSSSLGRTSSINLSETESDQESVYISYIRSTQSSESTSWRSTSESEEETLEFLYPDRSGLLTTSTRDQSGSMTDDEDSKDGKEMLRLKHIGTRGLSHVESFSNEEDRPRRGHRKFCSSRRNECEMDTVYTMQAVSTEQSKSSDYGTDRDALDSSSTLPPQNPASLQPDVLDEEALDSIFTLLPPNPASIRQDSADDDELGSIPTRRPRSDSSARPPQQDAPDEEALDSIITLLPPNPASPRQSSVDDDELGSILTRRPWNDSSARQDGPELQFEPESASRPISDPSDGHVSHRLDVEEDIFDDLSFETYEGEIIFVDEFSTHSRGFSDNTGDVDTLRNYGDAVYQHSVKGKKEVHMTVQYRSYDGVEIEAVLMDSRVTLQQEPFDREEDPKQSLYEQHRGRGQGQQTRKRLDEQVEYQSQEKETRQSLDDQADTQCRGSFDDYLLENDSFDNTIPAPPTEDNASSDNDSTAASNRAYWLEPKVSASFLEINEILVRRKTASGQAGIWRGIDDSSSSTENKSKCGSERSERSATSGSRSALARPKIFGPIDPPGAARGNSCSRSTDDRSETSSTVRKIDSRFETTKRLHRNESEAVTGGDSRKVSFGGSRDDPETSRSGSWGNIFLTAWSDGFLQSTFEGTDVARNVFHAKVDKENDDIPSDEEAEGARLKECPPANIANIAKPPSQTEKCEEDDNLYANNSFGETLLDGYLLYLNSETEISFSSCISKSFDRDTSFQDNTLSIDQLGDHVEQFLKGFQRASLGSSTLNTQHFPEFFTSPH